MIVSRELIEKYAVSGPRYTSYPTAVEFSSSVGAAEWKDELAQAHSKVFPLKEADSTPTFSIYIHLPFCHSLCYFCACNKVITQDKSVVEPYLRALIAELESYQSILGSDIPIEQIHWGGGTPNYLSPAQMKHLHLECLRVFPNLLPDADVSIEVDPRTLTLEHLEVLTEVGFNRLSMGVQDFNPEVQQLVNRVQPYEMTREVCDKARELGFSGLNIDLIYGLPGQTQAGFCSSIDKVLEFRPERVAMYGYAHVKWIQKVQKALERAHLPTPKERVALFLSGLERFIEADYRYIGMDHFALPDDCMSKALDNGRLNRNFMGYTTHRGARIIGLGASSISSLPGAFAQNVKSVAEYQNLIAEQGFAIERGLLLSEEDERRGEIIHGIMCEGVVEIGEHEARWGLDFRREYAEALPVLELFEADGFLTAAENQIVVTELGRFFMRNIAMAFDTYLAKHSASGKPVFSQAV